MDKPAVPEVCDLSAIHSMLCARYEMIERYHYRTGDDVCARLDEVWELAEEARNRHLSLRGEMA